MSLKPWVASESSLAAIPLPSKRTATSLPSSFPPSLPSSPQSSNETSPTSSPSTPPKKKRGFVVVHADSPNSPSTPSSQRLRKIQRTDEINQSINLFNLSAAPPTAAVSMKQTNSNRTINHSTGIPSILELTQSIKPANEISITSGTGHVCPCVKTDGNRCNGLSQTQCLMRTHLLKCHRWPVNVQPPHLINVAMAEHGFMYCMACREWSPFLQWDQLGGLSTKPCISKQSWSQKHSNCTVIQYNDDIDMQDTINQSLDQAINQSCIVSDSISQQTNQSINQPTVESTSVDMEIDCEAPTQPLSQPCMPINTSKEITAPTCSNQSINSTNSTIPASQSKQFDSEQAFEDGMSEHRAELHEALHRDSVIDSVAPPSDDLSDLLQIANHGRIAQHIPYANNQLWVEATRQRLNAVVNADAAKSDADMNQAIKDLLMLPSYLTKKRGGEKPNNRKQLSNHFKTCLTRAIAHETPPQSSIITRSQSAKSDLTEADKRKQRAKRINQLMSHEHVSKAAHIWMSDADLADVSSDQSINKLRELHPTCNDTLPARPSIAAADYFVVDADISLIKIIQSTDNGSSPGLSGWTAKLILATKNDPICLKGWAKVFNLIINNNLPEHSKQMLLACNLIAIKKPHDGLRPIAMGELFYRIAAKLAKQGLEDTLAAILQPIQHGLNTCGGCETAVHHLTARLEDENAVNCAAAIDFRNAFNSINRAKVLETLYKHRSLNRLWKIAEFAYSTPSPLLTKDENGKFHNTLQSEQGVRQGDPLASLLFALTIHPLYESILEQFPDVAGMAIHDDFTIVGSPDDVLAATSTIIEEAKLLGLTVQRQKTKFIYFHEDITPLTP